MSTKEIIAKLNENLKAKEEELNHPKDDRYLKILLLDIKRRHGGNIPKELEEKYSPPTIISNKKDK